MCYWQHLLVCPADIGGQINHESCCYILSYYRMKAPLPEQGMHRLEKYLNLECFLEKSLKIKSVLKSTGKSLKSLEKSINSTIFCRT